MKAISEAEVDSEASTKPCFFLDNLPRELRDQIYDYVFSKRTFERFIPRMAPTAPHDSEVPSKYIQRADISVEFPQFPQFPHTAMYSVSRQIAHEYALRIKIQIPAQPVDFFVREDWKYQHPQHPPLETLESILSLVKDVEV